MHLIIDRGRISSKTIRAEQREPDGRVRLDARWIGQMNRQIEFFRCRVETLHLNRSIRRSDFFDRQINFLEIDAVVRQIPSDAHCARVDHISREIFWCEIS